MERTFVFGSQVTSCVPLPSNMTMASALEKKCFLCNVKEIEENSLVDSQESSLILCKVFNVPHLMNDLKKLENINYCQPCKNRILKIHVSLDILKKLKKEALEEKYIIELQLQTNYKAVGYESHYSPWDFGVKLANEMRFKSVKSKLKKVFKNQIDRKFSLKIKKYRIMKNITITQKRKHGTFEKHNSKETTPLIYNIISTEANPFISDGHFVESATNSPCKHAELSLNSHEYNFDKIELEMLCAETNNSTDMKDPFEGIVPEFGYVTENPTTQKMFICETCETNFDEYSQLDEHCRTHIGSKSFYRNEFVPKVSLNTNSYIRVKKHLKCRSCVKVFPDYFKLKQHERIHTGEKPFKCSYCEKSFSWSHNAKKHERIHTLEKPFKCGYCEKTFREHRNQILHERIHTGEKPFQCSYCEKSFTGTHLLKIHQRIHTGEQPFKCGHCGKIFRDHYNMQSHELIHTGLKPFKCKFCEKSFTRKSRMDEHESLHTGEKQFKCKFCDKSFPRRETVITHERIHTGEKPYKCEHCDKTFGARASMKRHENIHKAEKDLKCKVH